MFVYGCLADFLRFLLGVLGLLCAVLAVVGLWLGLEPTRTVTIAVPPATTFAITLRGAVPGLHVGIWTQQPTIQTSSWVGAMTVPVVPIALSTMGLALVLLAVDRFDPRRR